MNHIRPMGPGRWIASLERLLQRFGPAPAVPSPHGQPSPVPWAAGAPMRVAARPVRAATTHRPTPARTPRHGLRSPLRVIRVVEAGQASALAGRILMSGRMADVCAELDRMVEREAAMQASI
ncbi:MAG: hypothetical protein H6929_14915 [Rhodoferax sp.]|nr:hypothetical protein [Rhodoferax sp.]